MPTAVQHQRFRVARSWCPCIMCMEPMMMPLYAADVRKQQWEDQRNYVSGRLRALQGVLKVQIEYVSGAMHALARELIMCVTDALEPQALIRLHGVACMLAWDTYHWHTASPHLRYAVYRALDPEPLRLEEEGGSCGMRQFTELYDQQYRVICKSLLEEWQRGYPHVRKLVLPWDEPKPIEVPLSNGRQLSYIQAHRTELSYTEFARYLLIKMWRRRYAPKLPPCSAISSSILEED